MRLTDIISTHVAYNYWANDVTVKWLKTLDRQLLMKSTPSSFPSIDLTLQHIIHSQNFWLAVLTKGDFYSLDERIRVNEVENVMEWLMTSSQKMIDTYTNYSEEELVEEVTTPDNKQSRFGFILHSINHGSYHRGQIVTMARCLGVTDGIPITDFDAFLWTKSN